ncbi:MAG: ABC transporter permease [Acidobacteriota bacterium]
MDWRDLFSLASSTVRAHRLRSVLTTLGILIGVASVILLTSIGEGTRDTILAEFTQFGTRIVSIHPGKTMTRGMPGAQGATVRKLVLEDVEPLRRIVGVEAIAPVVAGVARVEAGSRSRSVFVLGVNDAVPAVFQLGVRQGRFVPEGGARGAAPLAVLGPTLKRELFGEENPLGQHVRIGGQRFQVIGVMAPKGNILGLDLDDRAYVPVVAAQRLFNRDELIEIDLLFSSHVPAETIVAQVKRVMRERHDGEEDFTVITQAEMLGVLDRVLSVVSVAVSAIGGISLVVGAIGILTMMWISVNERTGEIGLCKAIGASRAQVLALFLVESALLSLAGGALGVASGMGIAQLLRIAVPALPVKTPLSYVAAALGVSALVGLGSGLLPARRAASLDPIEALRAE